MTGPSFWVLARSQYGNWASALGLAVSVVGFWLTIVTVRRATRKAEQAVQRALDRVSERLTFGLIRRSMRLAEEIRQFSRAREWTQATDRSEQLVTSLVTLSQYRHVQVDESAELAAMIDDAGIIVTQCETLLAKPAGPLLSAQARKVLNDMIKKLARMEGKRQNMDLEPSDGH